MSTSPALNLDSVAADVPVLAELEAVLKHFANLPYGDAVELQCDHEPVELKQQVQALWPDQFEWQLLDAGLDRSRFRVTRKQTVQRCCGACSGGH